MPRPQPRIIHSQFEVMADAMSYVNGSVEELVRRGARVARDGFPAGSMGGDGGSSEISRPTENTATAPPAHDPTGNDIREIFQNWENAYRSLLRAGVLCARVMAAEETKGLRQSTLSECKACHRDVANTDNDRILGAGYCRNCYAAFVRYRDNLPTTEAVNFAYFERQRREYLESKEPQRVTA